MVKAQDMFDDHEGWQREFAECAQVINLCRVSSTNAFDKMLQAYKTMIRAEREGEKKVNMNPSNLVSDIPYPKLWIIFSINEE